MACVEKKIRIILKSRKKEKIKIKKTFKINELIILSGNILSWTVCVESSCFLTAVGGCLPLPVLCFCSPSVSVIVIWRLYSSEGWGRAERKGGAFTSWPLWWHSNSAAVLAKWIKLLKAGTQCEKLGSWHDPQIQHMSVPVIWRSTGYAVDPEDIFGQNQIFDLKKMFVWPLEV